MFKKTRGISNYEGTLPRRPRRAKCPFRKLLLSCYQPRFIPGNVGECFWTAFREKPELGILPSRGPRATRVQTRPLRRPCSNYTVISGGDLVDVLFSRRTPPCKCIYCIIWDQVGY